MSTYSSRNHRLAAATRWNPAQPAERVTDCLLMSRGNSNSYLIHVDAGDVLVNCGWSGEAPRHRSRYEEALGRPLALAAIIYTRSHSDHVGGRHEFVRDGVTTIAQHTMARVVEFPQPLPDRLAMIGRHLPRCPDRPTKRSSCGNLQEPAHRF